MLREQYIQKYTYTEYQHWEDSWELINGYPYAMSPSPMPRHQVLGNKINYCFTQALLTNKQTCKCDLLYGSDWVISNDTVVKPDIMIVCGEYDDNKPIQISPFLIVEIFSPSTRLKDRNTKFTLYEQQGVKYYLMADPEKKTLENFQLIDKKFQEQKSIEIFELDSSCKIEVSLATIFSA